MWSTVLALALPFFFSTWYLFQKKMEYGKVVYNHRPGICRPVAGPVNGAEGVELVREEGIAFITSGILYLQPHRHEVPGDIFLYDFNQNSASEELKATRLSIAGASFDKNNFHPHGISHWVVNGVIRLYVVNHFDDFSHSIEVFDFDAESTSLKHVRSIRDAALVRPNDLVAVGVDEFIVTNDGSAQSELAYAYEYFINPNAGSVYYYSGERFFELLSRTPSSNGIAYDAKRNKLFVAMLMNGTINAYQPSKDRKSLTLLSSVEVHSGCDNLFVDLDGSVYSGCHPVAHEAMHALGDCDDKTRKAPSQVLRLKFDKSYGGAAISEVYSDDGAQLTASTQAVLHDNQMLIGSVCHTLLHCTIADPSVL